MFGGVPIAESVVVTWVIMAVLLILSLILVRNLKVENPGKKQLLLESGVSFLQDFFVGILGEDVNILPTSNTNLFTITEKGGSCTVTIIFYVYGFADKYFSGKGCQSLISRL